MLAKKEPNIVSSMIAHLHTVLQLHQRASHQFVWLEYNIQFRMEMAASADLAWICGDPWQYVACLPGQRPTGDPFEVSELEEIGTSKGKGKHPLEQERVKGNSKESSKIVGVCHLFTTAPKGCPYNKECIFTHKCTG